LWGEVKSFGVSDSSEIKDFVDEEERVLLEDQGQTWVLSHSHKEFLEGEGGCIAFGWKSTVED
jgi:hypothetical protein